MTQEEQEKMTVHESRSSAAREDLLKELKEEYGFSMDEISELLASYKQEKAGFSFHLRGHSILLEREGEASIGRGAKVVIDGIPVWGDRAAQGEKLWARYERIRVVVENLLLWQVAGTTVVRQERQDEAINDLLR